MKLERINENQIRCTLNKEDLARRHLKLSELAYGSEKAKSLFRELMMQAKGELNFDAENIPIMIEAIPVSSDCLVLVVTKVDEPDELDTRFSNFTEDPNEEEELAELPENAYADEILECFEHVSELIGAAMSEEDKAAEKDKLALAAVAQALTRVYSFDSLDTISELARVIVPYYNGKNTLYKDPSTSRYYLAISISGHSAIEFNKVCNILSEYGTVETGNFARLSFFEEHCEVIVKDTGLQVFATI